MNTNIRRLTTHQEQLLLLVYACGNGDDPTAPQQVLNMSKRTQNYGRVLRSYGFIGSEQSGSFIEPDGIQYLTTNGIIDRSGEIISHGGGDVIAKAMAALNESSLIVNLHSQYLNNS